MERLSREELLALLGTIMSPKGFTERQIDRMLLTFCANCPDPVGAMKLVVECLDPMTDEEMVDRAMNMPFRRLADVPTTEISGDHPLRNMAP